MKLLLIDPPELFLRGDGLTRQVQPLGLAYVGAAVADLADVRFLLPDTRPYVGSDPWGELAAAITGEAPDVIGITAVTATMPAAGELAALCKRMIPQATVVLGGVHATTLPAQALAAAPAVDWLVRGEGEATMRALLLALARRQAFDPRDIPGLCWRDASGLPAQAAPRAVAAELDALPEPLREGLVWPEHVQPAFYQAVITLRGCPYQCIYCAVPSLDESRTRYRSPAAVAAEVRGLRQRFAIPYLFFHDSVFTLHRRRTLELCRLLAEDPVPFCCQTRADRLDDEVLAAMVGAGLHQVFFGIESGDAETLRRMNKAMSLATIRDAVARTRAAGVRCAGFFLVGFPWEDEAAITRTLDFATDLGLDAISLFSATPLPGTALWDLAGAGARMPTSVDFRKPQVNLTAMDDATYAAVYTAAQARVDAYNQAQMMAGIAAAVRW